MRVWVSEMINTKISLSSPYGFRFIAFKFINCIGVHIEKTLMFMEWENFWASGLLYDLLD